MVELEILNPNLQEVLFQSLEEEEEEECKTLLNYNVTYVYVIRSYGIQNNKIIKKNIGHFTQS